MFAAVMAVIEIKFIKFYRIRDKADMPHCIASFFFLVNLHGVITRNTQSCVRPVGQ